MQGQMGIFFFFNLCAVYYQENKSHHCERFTFQTYWSSKHASANEKHRLVITAHLVSSLQVPWHVIVCGPKPL